MSDNQKLFEQYCETGNLNDVIRLLETDNSAYSYDGLKLACKNGYLEIVKLLYSRCEDDDDILSNIAYENEQKEILKFMIQFKLDKVGKVLQDLQKQNNLVLNRLLEGPKNDDVTDKITAIIDKKNAGEITFEQSTMLINKTIIDNAEKIDL